ncbi:tyrosine recombinase [Nitrobacter sp. Nb-311A]|nr:tyrosine recombinase [Nitrobacter sp. Nb-311A]
MILKSGNRFSEKIMLKQKDKRRVRFNAIETDSSDFHRFMETVEVSIFMF